DAKPVVVEVLTFGLRAAGETAELVDLHLDMTQPRVRVDAEGQLPLGADGALDVTARIQGEFEGRPISGVLEAAGTLAAIEATGTLTQPITARVVAHADLEQELPQWRASATVEPFALTTLLPGSRDVRFSATGIEARGRG